MHNHIYAKWEKMVKINKTWEIFIRELKYTWQIKWNNSNVMNKILGIQISIDEFNNELKSSQQRIFRLEIAIENIQIESQRSVYLNSFCLVTIRNGSAHAFLELCAHLCWLQRR